VQELEELFHASEELYKNHDKDVAKGLRLLLTHRIYLREGFDYLKTKIREQCSAAGNNSCPECNESLYCQYLATMCWPLKSRLARANVFMEFWHAYQSVHSNPSSDSRSGHLIINTSLDWGYFWEYDIHLSMEKHDSAREALWSHIKFLDEICLDRGSWRTHKDITEMLVDLARLEALCGNYYVAEACAQTASHFACVPQSEDTKYYCDEDESGVDDNEDDGGEDTDLEIAKTARLRLLEVLRAGSRVEGSATPDDSQRLSFLKEIQTSHLSQPQLKLSYRATEALLDPETWYAVSNCQLSGQVGLYHIERAVKSKLERDIENKLRRHDPHSLTRRHFTTTFARYECGCEDELDDGESCLNRVFAFTNEFGLKYMAPCFHDNVGYLFGSFAPRA